MGGGQKVRYVPRNQGKPNFLADIPGFGWDIPAVPEKFEKKICVRFWAPTLGFCRLSERVFVSQERVSSFPEKGADLRGSPGNFREVWGTSGEVWETSPGNLWIAVKFHSQRTSGFLRCPFCTSKQGVAGSWLGIARICKTGHADDWVYCDWV